MHIMDDDDVPAVAQGQQQREEANDGRPSWIRSLEAIVTTLVPLMPIVCDNNMCTPHMYSLSLCYTNSRVLHIAH